jgi:hypothetical protein
MADSRRRRLTTDGIKILSQQQFSRAEIGRDPTPCLRMWSKDYTEQARAKELVRGNNHDRQFNLQSAIPPHLIGRNANILDEMGKIPGFSAKFNPEI